MPSRNEEPVDPHGVFRKRIGLAAWSALIVAGTVPWADFVGHTHWQKVQWIPFSSPPVRVRDIVGNVAFYFPFGYFLMTAFPSRARVWHAVLLGGALSFILEWSQLYSHWRFPSVQDLLCNIVGSSAGAITASLYSSQKR